VPTVPYSPCPPPDSRLTTGCLHWPLPASPFLRLSKPLLPGGERIKQALVAPATASFVTRFAYVAFFPVSHSQYPVLLFYYTARLPLCFLINGGTILPLYVASPRLLSIADLLPPHHFSHPIPVNLHPPAFPASLLMSPLHGWTRASCPQVRAVRSQQIRSGPIPSRTSPAVPTLHGLDHGHQTLD
jgi:hypothetical protein